MLANKHSSSFRIIEPKRFNGGELMSSSSPVQTQHMHHGGSTNTSMLTTTNSINVTNNSNSISNQFNTAACQSNNSSSYDFVNRSFMSHSNQNMKSNSFMAQQQAARIRNLSDTDSSYVPETTSESGISDLDMSEKCSCCPYGYHIDVGFVNYCQTLGGKNIKHDLKRIQRKRNETIKRSMEYVIDEVEKLRQFNENLGASTLQNCSNESFDYTSNTSTQNQRSVVIPPRIKNVIKHIDEQISSNLDMIDDSTDSCTPQPHMSKKLVLLNSSSSNIRNSSLNVNGSNRNLHNPSSTSLTPTQRTVQYTTATTFIGTPPPQPTATSSQTQFRQVFDAREQQFQPPCQQPELQLLRRSYSSCGEPNPNMIGHQNRFQNSSCSSHFCQRSVSNRASPIRPVPIVHTNANNHLRSNSYRCEERRSRSVTCNQPNQVRAVTKSPVVNSHQIYRREIKINLAQPPPPKPELTEEYNYTNSDETETRTLAMKCPATPPPPPRITTNILTITQQTTMPQPEPAQEEVLLNLFSCNNSGSISSESSESLVDLCDPKLKINEVYEKREEKRVDCGQPKRINNQQILLLEKKIAELEKKLQKIPELEIKNNILMEEKQLLLKQILNMKQQNQTPPPPPPVKPCEKVYRSIGCNPSEVQTRDMGIDCRANTRDVGTYDKFEEKKEEIEQMQTIITTLRDQLRDQTVIMHQLQIRPVTRDVAVMHVVDKVEEPKPIKEYRDVAISHTTEVDNSEIIEKHNTIVNEYIKQVECLRIENARLSCELKDLIARTSKHVVTRGTCTPEQPALYSVGTNTKRVLTRDVQLMFTPKSRDVSLCTDSVNHIRDVAIMCSLDSAEHAQKMEELIQVRRKYEHHIEEIHQRVSNMRTVSTVCNLDFKESRTIGLGCNLEEVKTKRDVALKCNLDQEQRVQCDVAIACCMDRKPEQRDAQCFAVEHKETRHFATHANLEDPDKLRMNRELEDLRVKISLCSQRPSRRDVSCNVDSRSRQAENLTRNQSSSMEQIRTSSRQVNTDCRSTRETSCGTTSYEHLHISKSCQVNDNSQEVFTSELIQQKNQLEYERNQYMELNNELKLRIREWEDKYHHEHSRILAMESNADCLKNSPKQSKNISTSTSNLCNITATITTTSNKTSTKTSNADSQFARERSLVLNTDNEQQVLASNNCSDYLPIVKRRESEYEQHKHTTTTRTTRTQQDTIRLVATISNKGANGATDGEKTCQNWSKTSTQNFGNKQASITISTNGKNNIHSINIRSRSNSTEPPASTTTQPCGNNNANSASTSVMRMVSSSSLKSEKGGEANMISYIDDYPSRVDEYVVSSSDFGDSGFVPSGACEQSTKNIAHIDVNNSALNSTSDLNCSSSMLGESKMQITTVYNKDGDVVERNAYEKIEMKKPTKSILKSSSGVTDPCYEPGQQKKALTFGENEIFETVPSETEQSEEDALVTGEDGYLTSTVTYETPITTIEYLAGDGVNEEERDQTPTNQFMKTELGNTTASELVNTEEFDDYEMQERLSNDAQMKSFHEDPNDSSSFELELELHIACAILNDSLYEPLKADKNKVAKALALIQQDWFKLAAQKDSDPALVEEHLNAFYSRFSNLLLERIVNMADANLNTVLHYSVSTGNFEIVNLLLDTKVCDVNAQNKAGYTSIMLAALVPIKDDYERKTLKRLFAEGNVNIKSTDSGQTALMLAVRHGNKDAVSLLLEASADCNVQDKEGSTALMAACEHGHIDIVRLLLDNTNCDPDIKDNDGETAFDIAKNKNRNDIIVLLYAHSSKLRSHHPAIQFSKSRPRIGNSSFRK